MRDTSSSKPERKKANRQPRKATPHKRLIDINQGESEYGPPRRTIHDWITGGHLPFVRLPGTRKIWIDRADFESLIEKFKECNT